MKRAKLIAALLGIATFAVARFAPAAVDVTLTPDFSAPRTAIAPDFAGLSYETARVLPDDNGSYYFTDQNKPLVEMFRTLGIRSLRVGGNSVDKPEIKIPGPADIDRLFAFARAADVKILYGLRMKGETSPDKCALPAVRYIMDRYANELICFGIGNEPTYYIQPGAYPYSSFLPLFNKYLTDLTAPGAVPNAKFAGPSASGSKPDWPRWSAWLADNDRGNPHLALISQHWYVGGSSRKVTDAAAGRDFLLSPSITQMYEAFAEKFVPEVKKDGLPFRMEETNSYSNAGAKNVSDTFASALWGLDYLYFWASQGASGVNLHTGDAVAAGQVLVPCNYALFWSTPSGYDVHPLGYSMKAFTLAAQGHLVPIKLESNGEANIRAYGCLADNSDFFITIINKEHGSSARDAQVKLSALRDYSRGETMALTCASHDVAAKTGVTLGGAAIDRAAHWNGKWSALPQAGKDTFVVTVPAASALIVRLSDMRLVRAQ